MSFGCCFPYKKYDSLLDTGESKKRDNNNNNINENSDKERISDLIKIENYC